VIARLVVLLLLAVSSRAQAAELGWSVKPPAGWTEDPAAGARLAEETKAGFFAGTKVAVRASVFRGPGESRSQFLIVILQTGPIDQPLKLLERWAETLARPAGHRTRTEDGREIVDLELTSEAGLVRGTLQTVRHDGVQHLLSATCIGELAEDQVCKRAVGSVTIGEPEDDGFAWSYWISIAGALLVSIALVSWRIELRRRS